MKKALSIAILTMAACAFLGAQQPDWDKAWGAWARQAKPQPQREAWDTSRFDSLLALYALSVLPHRRLAWLPVLPMPTPLGQHETLWNQMLYRVSLKNLYSEIERDLSWDRFLHQLELQNELFSLRHEIGSAMYWEREKWKSDVAEAARGLRLLIDELKREKR